MRRISRVTWASIILWLGMFTAVQAAFQHPGLLHTRADLDRMRQMVREGTEPWKGGFEKLRMHRQSQSDWRLRGPFEKVSRGARENLHNAELADDGNAAYQNALMWAIMGDEVHARKAVEILNAWSGTLQEIAGHDKELAAALYGFKYVNAAEIIRYTYDGWSPADVKRFEAVLGDVFYPVIRDFATFANGNWDTACIKTMMAFGVFLDDRAMFDRAVEYFHDGAGNGSLTHYIINEAGQCQESGRDQQHTQLGLAHLAEASEIGWNHGLDLYGAADNRLLKGFEYTAKYNLDQEVPFEPYRDKTGKYHAKAISTQGRNRLRPVYEMVLNHYEKRKGIPAPYTRQAAEKLRPEGAAFQADHPGFGTLLFTLPRADENLMVTLEPRPREGVLLNPGKGWSAGGLPERHPKEVADLLGMGVMRLDWASLEPQEGQFHWDTLDRFLNSWGRLDKVCNIGVMCANTHGRDPNGYVTPKWVFDAGAKKIEIMLNPDQSTTGTPGRKIAPVFDDPVFLGKFANFLRAFANRYDGDPRIAVLDIRSYGNWGEAHMHPFGVPDIAPEKFRQHVQMHLDVFKRTPLCISRNAHLGRFGPLKPVFDWAVLEKHVAPRRDGICGNSDGSETAIGFGIAPGVFELFDNYDGVKRRGWWDGTKDKGGCGFTLEECIENGKPTWVDLGRGGESGLRMVRENRQLIERLTNRIGYHFHLQRASYFRRAKRGGLDLELTWINQGVAPIYIPCAVAVALLDESGKCVVTAWPQECRPYKWMPDQPAVEKLRIEYSGVPTGKYRLALALTRRSGDSVPYIQLGTNLPAVEGWYVLGEVEAEG